MIVMSDMYKGWGDPAHFLSHLEAGKHVSSLCPEEPSSHIYQMYEQTHIS